MTSTRLVDESVAERAEQAADRAARDSGVSIALLDAPEDLRAVNKLLAQIWLSNGSDPVMTTSLLTAFAHSGNYVAGAYRASELVGASVGFLARRSDRIELHSHITGIARGVQGRSIGYAVKQHQRAWALFHGIEAVTWTFDPLVGRNGYFNLTKLGAEIVGYHENFYGSMSDSINRDDETDRCLVAWDLRGDRVLAAAEKLSALPAVDLSGARALLDQNGSGLPTLSKVEAPVLLALIPRDIVQLRTERPSEAAAWRLALRSALQWAFDRGYTVKEMTRDGRYVLTQSG